VETILSTPIAVNMFGVGKSITSGAAHIRHKDCETAQGEILDQRHGEPGEVGAFLYLWTAVNVVYDRARTFKAESTGGEIKPSGGAQAIVRNERSVLTFGKIAIRNPQNL